MMWLSSVLCTCWCIVNAKADLDYSHAYGIKLDGALRNGVEDLPNITFTPNPLIPSNSQCGQQVEDRIFNGEVTELDEFPWMALLFYLTSKEQLVFACGGSLINHRYILTAAHCITGDILLKVGQPVYARLGEYNVSSPYRDCVQHKGLESCNDPEINAKIEELIPHPDYNDDGNLRNDIGLIRLQEDIKYSDYVQPLCLPQPNYESELGSILTVAGWGRTEYGSDSDVKLKVQIPKVDLSTCAHIFGSWITDNQICAGGEYGKDSCADYVQPICLPQPTDEAKLGDMLTVAGWGKTEQTSPTDVKLKVRVPKKDLSMCAGLFNVTLGNDQICAGGKDEKGSCKGDSGGPLMNKLPKDETRWTIEGVVSFGMIDCAKGDPSLYTKVADYVEWIHKTVKT